MKEEPSPRCPKDGSQCYEWPESVCLDCSLFPRTAAARLSASQYRIPYHGFNRMWHRLIHHPALQVPYTPAVQRTPHRWPLTGWRDLALHLRLMAFARANGRIPRSYRSPLSAER